MRSLAGRPELGKNIQHSGTIGAIRSLPRGIRKGARALSGVGSRKWRDRAALAALLAAGCNARIQEERGVWNLYAIEAALEQGGTVATGPTLPAGLPASDFLTMQNADGKRALKVWRAFADGQPAAYVSSEIWVDYYDEVWLQPIYAQFATADLTVRLDPRLVIDVGPESAFYSPFWQVNAAVVGDGPGYHSTKQLLDGASQIIPVGMKTCPLRPLDVGGSGLSLPPPWDVWNGSISLLSIR